MAIAIAKVNTAGTNHVIGNRREVCIDATLDSSYPTNGYALTPATLGVDGALDFIMAFATTTGHTFAYDYAAKKLKAYSGGTEISNATDLSAVVVRIVAHGKGNGLTQG